MHTKRKNNTENYKCFSFSCVAFVWILWIFYFDNIKHNFLKKFQVHKMKVFDCSERIFCKYFLFPCNLNSFHYIIHSKVNHCLPPFIVISPFFLLYICRSETVKEIATNLSKSPNKTRLQRHSHAASFSVHSFLEAEFLFGLDF